VTAAWSEGKSWAGKTRWKERKETSQLKPTGGGVAKKLRAEGRSWFVKKYRGEGKGYFEGHSDLCKVPGAGVVELGRGGGELVLVEEDPVLEGV
jgi:hypothetical protein